jgi:Lon protease-like protein
MKWSFDKGMGSMKELGAVGSEGEFYFHPSKMAKLSPQKILGKSRTIPIFPQQNILLPGSTEWIHVFEMRNRHMMHDVGDGVFGLCYTSQQYQKLGLVGTLGRIKQRKILEDGRTFVSIEGLERFYLQEIIGEKPYIKAKVQVFSDFTEYPDANDYMLDVLEAQIFDEVRFNMKLMKILFPSKNYSLSTNILAYRPAVSVPGVRSIKTVDAASEAERRSKFSFSIIDMLQIPATTKLLLLQVGYICRIKIR